MGSQRHRPLQGARTHRFRGLFPGFLLLVIFFLAAGAGAGQNASETTPSPASEPDERSSEDQWSPADADGGSSEGFFEGFTQDTLEQLAEEATKAVVLIDTRTASTTRQGSGVLVDPGGHILTNHHVVRDARSIRVKLASGDVYDHVTILAIDERRDIAVLKISGFDLPSLPLGNSDSISVGASVVLIGSPLGLENTVSTGIISGRRQEPEGFQLFQLSAPASQGSSGGPVLSRTGEVVAIAASQMEAGQNLNFAVPINYARGLLDHLDREPVAVLTPTPAASTSETEQDRSPMRDNAVNRGLRFDMEGFRGYTVEMEAHTGEGHTRRTLITYRRIEAVGDGEPRIERYFQSETTRQTEPFGTPQTIRSERTRTLVESDDLRPVSTRGETEWWTGEGWTRSRYDLRVDGSRLQGMSSDTTGQSVEIDRDLPEGILFREMRNLAFATVAADSLVGQSVELASFDPYGGEVIHDRYDVEETTSTSVAGRTYSSYRVNLASGLSNGEAYFRIDRPRILLRFVSDEGDEVEEVTRLEIREGDAPDPPDVDH